VRDLLLVGVALGCIVYAAAVVGKAIAHDEVGHSEHQIVAIDLIEGLLGQFHVRGFELEDDEGTPFLVVKDGIGALAHTILLKADFMSQPCLGVSQDVCEPMGELLAHPFLGSGLEPTTADEIPNIDALIIAEL
jgi:hypothetical protein